MQQHTLPLPKHILNQKPEFALTFINPEKLIGKAYTHYAIIQHESGIQFKEDQHGPYKTSDTKISLHLYNSQEEEAREHQIGMAENFDDSYDAEMIASGNIPDEIQYIMNNPDQAAQQRPMIKEAVESKVSN